MNGCLAFNVTAGRDSNHAGGSTFSGWTDDVCDESEESVDALILSLAVMSPRLTQRWDQGVGITATAGFRGTDDGLQNSLEELQHSRKHLCDGLHGEELVPAWRENHCRLEVKIHINEDACLNTVALLSGARSSRRWKRSER